MSTAAGPARDSHHAAATATASTYGADPVVEPSLTVGGKQVAGEDGTYAVANPVRPGETVALAPAASASQVDAAVASARAASAAWAALTLDERIERVVAAAAAVPVGEDLARLLTRENGKVLDEARFETSALPLIAQMVAATARLALARTGVDGGPALQRAPHGVVAAVLPFNWPVAVFANKVFPALVTGNTVVVKPPPTCPAAVLQAVAAMAAVLPAGVLNAVNGPGAEVGRHLVGHRDVDMTSFTGGVATGRAVAEAAAARLLPAVLELGGNDAALVAADVDVDDAVAARILDAAFMTSGQVCMALKRLYVPHDRVDRVAEALAVRCADMLAGDGLLPEVTTGPVHTARARAALEDMVARAVTGGARVAGTGRVREEDARAGGHLVAPCVVAGAPPSSALVVEEQFGPVLPVVGYTDLDDAVAQANRSSYGLCASVWTRDGDLAAAVASQLEAGTVFVNHHGPSAVDPRAPFGGWKSSGLGLEMGEEGVLAFTRLRAVVHHDLPGGSS